MHNEITLWRPFAFGWFLITESILFYFLFFSFFLIDVAAVKLVSNSFQILQKFTCFNKYIARFNKKTITTTIYFN